MSQPRPIFIVGAPRSGTSVLTWALGQHPNILPLEETYWIAQLALDLEAVHLLGSTRGERSHLSSRAVGHDEFFRSFGEAADGLIRSHKGPIEHLAVQAGERDPSQDNKRFKIVRSASDPKARWVDGTPENSFSVYGLALLFPEAKFIHLLRDVRSVVRSLLNFHTIGGPPHTADDAYRNWLRKVRACLDAERAFGSNTVLRIRHADLLRDSEAVLRRCLEFVGERFNPDCLLPLQEKINSSKEGIARAETDRVDPTLITEAEELSRRLLEEAEPDYGQDPAALERLRRDWARRSGASGFDTGVRELLRTLPNEATVLVASRGDDSLLKLDGHRGMHFPQRAGGTPAPADGIGDAELVRQLERLRNEGAGYLLIPATEFSWLERHPELKRHLKRKAELVGKREAACLLYQLDRDRQVTGTEAAAPAYEALRARVRDAVEASVSRDAHVAVVSRGDDSLLHLPVREATHFPSTATGEYAGHHPADDEEAIAELERARASGVDTLVFPRTSLWWLDHYVGLRDHLQGTSRPLYLDDETAVIYALDGPGRGSVPVCVEAAISTDSDHEVHRAADAAAEAIRPYLRSPLYERAFPLWEERGFHVTPVHFYFPIPDTRELREDLWERPSELVGIDLREREQLRLLREVFPRFRSEYDAFPLAPTETPYEFHLNNNFFDGTDALVLYCMVRHFRPRLIIEVGSGYSTRVSAQAARRNGDTHVVCIEPYPSDVVKAGIPGVERLIERKVEDVGLELFAELGENDILFIDSSHVVSIGNDVNHLYLEVLPRLNPGVLVHVHDISLPFEVREDFVREQFRFWTEQYLLQAFLTGNQDHEVIFANTFMEYSHPLDFRSTFAKSPWWGGGSFWFRRNLAATRRLEGSLPSAAS